MNGTLGHPIFGYGQAIEINSFLNQIEAVRDCLGKYAVAGRQLVFGFKPHGNPQHPEWDGFRIEFEPPLMRNQINPVDVSKMYEMRWAQEYMLHVSYCTTIKEMKRDVI